MVDFLKEHSEAIITFFVAIIIPSIAWILKTWNDSIISTIRIERKSSLSRQSQKIAVLQQHLITLQANVENIKEATRYFVNNVDLKLEEIEKDVISVSEDLKKSEDMRDRLIRDNQSILSQQHLIMNEIQLVKSSLKDLSSRK